jgi:SAM-dependent methyltransferase
MSDQRVFISAGGDAVPAGSARGLPPATRQASFERMHLQPGHRVLDVGCGTGATTLAMAHAVGEGGVVHGVDYDATMIAHAWQRARGSDVAARVQFHHANATALPWPDHYFNACHSDRIFQQMLAPEQAFEELLRVTQPGGRVVVINGDWATLSIDSDEADIESRLAHFAATLLSGNPISGQCLHHLFSSMGLLDIQVDVQPLFDTNLGAVGCWQQSRSPDADAAGLFASANVVMVSGRTPPAQAAVRS